MTRTSRLRKWIPALVTALILTSNCRPTLHAQRRPSGTIAYNSFDPETDRGEVRLVNADGRNDRPLALRLVTGLVALPVWSRDGKAVAVTGTAPDDGGPAASEIFIFEPAASTLHKVTHLNVSGNSVVPVFKAFSSDRQQLAYVAFGSGGRAILAVNRLNGAVESVVADSVTPAKGFPFFGLDWYPRANLLATAGVVHSETDESIAMTALFMVRPAADAVRQGFYWQLTFPRPESGCDCSLHDVLPVFSPTGGQIAFVRWTIQADGRRTKSSIRLLDLFQGKEREIISFWGETVVGLSWSPDGTKLAFDRGQDSDGIANPGSLGLWTVRIDGTVLRHINTSTALSASWSWGR